MVSVKVVALRRARPVLGWVTERRWTSGYVDSHLGQLNLTVSIWLGTVKLRSKRAHHAEPWSHTADRESVSWLVKVFTFFSLIYDNCDNKLTTQTRHSSRRAGLDAIISSFLMSFTMCSAGIWERSWTYNRHNSSSQLSGVGFDMPLDTSYRDDLPSQSLDWCKTPSLLNRSLG